MLKTVAEAHKMLEMVSEQLKLIESESGAVNQIIQGVIDMVAAAMEEDTCKMILEEADALKIMSTMVEAIEAHLTKNRRNGTLKMVAEAPKKLETAAVELNLIESEYGAIMSAQALIEGGSVDLLITYAVAEVAKEN